MRSSQKSGRSRGKGNRGKPQGHSPNRVYESAGPEGKVRGTPQQIIDKYLALARDAQLSGDRVGSENFLQHAEHYARILIAVQEAQQDRRDQNQPNGQNRLDDDQPYDGQPYGGQSSGGQSSGGQSSGGQSSGGDRSSGGGQSGSGDRSSGGRQNDQRARNDRSSGGGFGDDDQPASDGLGAIDAAQDAPEIVETPESKSEAPKPRSRRPRPKPPAAETSSDGDGDAKKDEPKVEAAE